MHDAPQTKNSSATGAIRLGKYSPIDHKLPNSMHEQNYIPQILSNVMGQYAGLGTAGGLDPADLG